MILARVIQDLIRGRGAESSAPAQAITVDDRTPSVLNVGGGSKAIPIPEHYRGWRHLLLDIDPKDGPDVVCDARNLAGLAARQFDAIYCSHNLEHYYRHDGIRVLHGFLHVLKPEGFAEIRVPDLQCVMRRAIATGMDIDDVLYDSPSGQITICDVLYGWGKQIESSGVDFYAHKTGFSPQSLRRTLEGAGFTRVFVQERNEIYEVRALAFKAEPTAAQRSLLGIPR